MKNKLDELDKLEELVLDENTDHEKVRDICGCLKDIQGLRKSYEEDKTKFRIDPNTLAIIAANLLGIAIVCAFEKSYVLGGKGLGFVTKLKI